MCGCLGCCRKSLTGFLACCLCDCLCCECNCLIFPSPRPSYEKATTCLSQGHVKTTVLQFLTNAKQIPYVEVSTQNSRRSKKCVIFFHGNGEDIGLAGYFLEPLVRELNLTFYAIEYPSYSYYETCWAALISNTIKQDALAFYDFLLNNSRTPQDIYVMGRSIGSGGASYLAGHRNIPYLILISPFDTIKKVALKVAGCVGWLVKQHFNNEEEVVKHSGQLLVIHGESDQVIGVSHGRNLVAVYESQNMHKRSAKASYPNRMSHNYFNMQVDIIQPIKAFVIR